MKSARRELAPNQNAAFHPGNRAGVFIWRIFIPPADDLASPRRDLEVSQLAYSYERDVNFDSKTIRRRDHR